VATDVKLQKGQVPCNAKPSLSLARSFISQGK